MEDGNLKRTVRVYVDEELNPETTVTGGAFTISNISDPDLKSVSGASITAVSIHNDPTKPYNQNAWIELTLVTPTDLDPHLLNIAYNPPLTGGIYDLGNIPNPMKAFDLTILNNNLFDVKPQINSIFASHDGKYLSIVLIPNINGDDYNIKVNGKEYATNIFNSAPDFGVIQIYNPDATGILSSYDIEITGKDGGKLYDTFGQEYVAISNPDVTTIVDSSVTAESAVLNPSEKTLTLTLDTVGFSMPYGCQFVLNIDGVSYRLRGEVGRDNNASNDNKEVYIFDAYNLFDVDFSKITNSSSITLSFNDLTTAFPEYFETSGKPVSELSVKVDLFQ
jgi:hypothetical protein